MSDTKAMQRLCGLMRKAVQQYEMLAPGDRVLVGVSGGKDSVALTIGLARLRQYLGFPFEVVAVTLDPQFGGKPVDYSALEALFRQYDVSYEVRRTLIGPTSSTTGTRRIPAPSAPRCAGARSTPLPKSWTATRWRWDIIWTTPSRRFT